MEQRNGDASSDYLSKQESKQESIVIKEILNSINSASQDVPDIVQELLYENRLLQENLAESNASMQAAYEALASAQDAFAKEKLEFQERCGQAKEVVAALREKVKEQEQVIEELRGQDFRKSTSSATKSVDSALRERDELKNKCVSLEMQIDSLLAPSEEQRRKDKQTIESLQRNLNALKAAKIKDQQETLTLSASLDYLRSEFDDLIVEYETSINAEKALKATILAKDNEIEQLNLALEKEAEQHLRWAAVCKSFMEAETTRNESLNQQCAMLKSQLMQLTMSKDSKQRDMSGPSSLNVMWRRDVCVCPKCGHKSPDADALLKHCHSCET